MNTSKTPLHLSAHRSQSGAALMVMLVIMIIGTAIFLVTSLSKVTLSNERNKAASDMLAQSKEVIIGYMLRGGSSTLGWMMVPDVLDVPSNSPTFPEKSPTDNSLVSNYDGEWESNCLDVTKPASIPPYTPLTSNKTNKRCFGRLPWKSLGMSISSPSENDPTGFMPWYAFSRNLISSFKLNGNPLQVNSELLNPDPTLYPWLKVYDMNGTLLSDRVAFVIIIPGPALPNQSRPPSPNLANPDQYLDSIALPAGCSPTGTPCTTTYRNYDLSETFVIGDEHRWMNDPANPGKQIEDPTYQFNDKLLYVTIDELMPLIEKRIAREVKACLDDYANAPINTGHKYPWAALVSDTSPSPNRAGTYNVRFGRVSDTPSISKTAPGTPPSEPLLTYLNDVQTALDNFKANNNSTTVSALRNKGDILKDHTSSGTSAHTAGEIADGCTSSACDTTTLQTQLDIALGKGTPDSTMPSTWSSVASCNQLFNVSSYWADWRDLIFYQVAAGFEPGGGGSCTVGTTCLSISGSGNPAAGSGSYRAAVAVAGKMLAGQSLRPISNTPVNSSYENNYLEASNNHQSSAGSTPSVNFVTYKPSDTLYPSVNDLVLCLDGKSNCQ